MHSIVSEPPHVQIGQAGAVAVRNERSDPPPRKSPGGGPWVNRVPVDFLDARKNGGIGHRHGWMLLVLEGYCRARSYCWVRNAELADAFGCKRSALKSLLTEMQDKGLIHRQMTAEGRGRPDRVGIVLLKRANPDLPVAGLDNLGDVIDLMMGTIEDNRDRRHGQQTFPLSGPTGGRKTDPSGVGKPTPPRGRKTDPRIKTLSFEEREIEVGPPNPRTEFLSLSLNDNDRTPDPEPIPQAAMPDQAEAIAEEPARPPAVEVAIDPPLQADPGWDLAPAPAKAEGVPDHRKPDPPEVDAHLEAFIARIEEPMPPPPPRAPDPGPDPGPDPHAPVTGPAEAEPDPPTGRRSRSGDVCPHRSPGEYARLIAELMASSGRAAEHPAEPPRAPVAPTPIDPPLQADPGSKLAVAPLEAKPPPPAMAFDLARGFVDSGSKAVPSRPSEPCPAPPRPVPRPTVSLPAAAEPKADPPFGWQRPLTEGGSKYLGMLDADEQARFDALSPAKRAEHLGCHFRGFDMILAAHFRKQLAPPAAPVEVKLILTIEDAVEAIVGGYRPATRMLAEMLARELNDWGSRPFFDQIGGRLLEDPSRTVGFFDALRQARKPKADRPGAILVTVLKRDYGWGFKRP